MPRPHTSRSQRLIQPRLQLWLVGSFVGLAALALLLQFLVMSYRLTSMVSELEGANEQLVADLPVALMRLLLISLGVLLPIIFAFGVLLTFRVAGPIHRFEVYLQSVLRGEQVGPCKIRKGDKLQALCELINEATEPVRRRTSHAPTESSQAAAE